MYQIKLHVRLKRIFKTDLLFNFQLQIRTLLIMMKILFITIIHIIQSNPYDFRNLQLFRNPSANTIEKTSLISFSHLMVKQYFD